jgi:serine/threonine protein kinase
MFLWVICRLFTLVALGAASWTTQALPKPALSTLLPKNKKELKDPKGYYKPLFNSFADKACIRNNFKRERALSSRAGSKTPTLVYIAHHIVTDKSVVIKRVTTTSLESIRMEEIVLHMLDHPNVSKGICTFLEDDCLAVNLVLEFTTESTLCKRMDTSMASDPGFLRNVARQLVNVLAYLHDQNILHNDIKPENILVSDNGTVKLIDYDLATFSDSDGITAGGGTPMYRAPEESLGFYTNGADWYALAATLFEVANGCAH